MQDSKVLVVLRASPGRRFLGVGCLAGLGAMLVYLALVQSPSMGWQLFMVGTGAVSLWLAERMWRATALHLELTREGLRTSDGRIVAPIGEVQSVERGVFAFKPSSGFLIRLRSRAPRAWQPGMWWRIGRQVGVGGVTPSAQAKAMAEIMSDLVATRDRDAARDGD